MRRGFGSRTSSGVLGLSALLVLPAVVGFMAQGREPPGNLSQAQKAQGEPIRWRDFQGGRQEARKNHLPLLLFFYSSDPCTFSKKYLNTSFADRRIGKLLSQGIIPALIPTDSPEGEQIATQWGIRFVPTVVVATPAGEVLGRLEGYTGAEELEPTLREMVNKGQETKPQE